MNTITTEAPRFDWTNVGEKNISPNERGLVLAAIDVIDNQTDARAGFNEWLPIVGTRLSLSFMAGEAIKVAIEQLKIPNVTHVAVCNDLAPLGFYGIRAHYAPQRRTRVDIFIIDAGDSCAPVVMRVWPLLAEADAPARVVVNTEPAKPVLTCTKVAWIRDANATEGRPASGRLNCKCGNAPVSEFKPTQADILCACGVRYSWRGEVL